MPQDAYGRDLENAIRQIEAKAPSTIPGVHSRPFYLLATEMHVATDEHGWTLISIFQFGICVHPCSSVALVLRPAP
jgi:hypothetical protein